MARSKLLLFSFSATLASALNIPANYTTWNQEQLEFQPDERCYWPDNSPADVGYGGACSIGEGACCPAGWNCLSNGLCEYPSKDKKHLKHKYRKYDTLHFLVRFACQEPKEGGPSPCGEICTDQFGRGDTYQEVKRCDDDTYCCNGDGSGNCCLNTWFQAGFHLPAYHTVRSMPTLSIKTTKTTTVATTTSNRLEVTGPPTVLAEHLAIVSTTITVGPSPVTASYGTQATGTGLPRARLLRDLLYANDGKVPAEDKGLLSKVTKADPSGAHKGKRLSIPVWAIPAGILGGLLLTAIGSLLALCLFRRRRRNHDNREKNGERDRGLFGRGGRRVTEPRGNGPRSNTAPYTQPGVSQNGTAQYPATTAPRSQPPTTTTTTAPQPQPQPQPQPSATRPEVVTTTETVPAGGTESHHV